MEITDKDVALSPEELEFVNNTAEMVFNEADKNEHVRLLTLAALCGSIAVNMKLQEYDLSIDTVLEFINLAARSQFDAEGNVVDC